MRLKKLLAAVVSGALAVMSLASLPVSAAVDSDVTVTTIYDITNDPGGKVCGAAGELFYITADQLSSASVTADNIGDCSVKIEFAAAPSGATVGVNIKDKWDQNFVYETGVSGASHTSALSGINDKDYKADSITTGLMVQIKDATVKKVSLVKDSVETATFEYTAGIMSEYSFSYVDAGITSEAEEYSVTVTGDGANDYSYFYLQETTSWKCSEGSKPTVTINSDVTGYSNFMSATGCKIIFDKECKVNKIEVAVKHKAATSDITVSPATATVKVGETTTLTATPAEGVTWTSDNTAVATVENGVVTGVAEGTATITATLGEKTATCTVTVTKAGTVDPTPSANYTIWEGSQDMGTDWKANVMIPAEKFADIKAGETIKIKFTKGNAEYFQLKIASMAEGWPALASPEGQDPTYHTVVASESPFTFEINAEDLAAVQANGMALSGYGVTVTKVYTGEDTGSTTKPDPEPDPETLTINKTSASLTTGDTVTIEATPAEGVTWTSSNESVATVSGGVVTAVGAGTATITATLGGQTATCTVTVTAPVPVVPEPLIPSIPYYPPVFPSYTVTTPTDEPQLSGGAVGQGWNTIEDKISETADGGKVTVNMNGATTLPKEVLDNVSGKDVDLVLNMKGGVTWTINGTDVDKASDIDMKVTVGTRGIPKEVIEAVEGGNGVKQISLSHNGTFGFTATMTISLGKINDGQYANLFYYNPTSKSLEFVDASIISGGKANLIFTHASDYAIIMSDAPLGSYEDVSAAAGVISSESADTTVFFACGAVVLAVAAAYAIYRKRSRG